MKCVAWTGPLAQGTNCSRFDVRTTYKRGRLYIIHFNAVIKRKHVMTFALTQWKGSVQFERKKIGGNFFLSGYDECF